MRLPRIIHIIRRKGQEGVKEYEEDEFLNLSREIEEASENIEEVEESEYSEILLSEPDEEKKEGVKGKEYILPQFYLSHEEKKSIEKETFEDSEEKLKEKAWEKSAKESLEEIERIIDAGLAKKAEVFEEKQPPEEKYEEFLEGEGKVKGRIINREVIYETPGGYVVKVTYRENGRVRTAYYSVSKVEGVEHALDEIRKYKPLIREEKIKETVEPAPKEDKSKKSFFEGILGKKKK
ncbi:MAG: hypothetical protein U9O96_07730 [Candidatus Thermoplasmatota archaeon]|nr:hypothetical protein [Candidatus Thermoplasmatota archaeon]